MSSHDDPRRDAATEIDRRGFLQRAALGTAAVALGSRATLGVPRQDPSAVIAQIAKQHDTTVTALQDWIKLPSIAAENVGYPAGADYLARLAREAGFQQVEVIPTKGKPGVFATLDAGARNWLAIYFMYDVKHYDPAEWSSPPLEARIVDKPGFGKVMVGRGATNTKGPQMAALAALHAFRGAGVKLPVNLVLVAEGEEEIGSPNFHEIVFSPQVERALRRCLGVIIAAGRQAPDGSVEVPLGGKGIVELELVSTGEKWGRGPRLDIHSSLMAYVDSPAWHLVQALNTLVKADGHTPAVAGFFDRVKPLTPRERQIIEAGIPRKSEADTKRALGVQRWIDDASWPDALLKLVSQPTINIQGLVGGYTGQGS